MSKTSLDKSKIKFLLLEGVHQSAVEVLKSAGYTSIEYITSSLPEAQLKEKIADAHFIGIRSRTQLTEEVFDCAKKLVAVGCFCIGTNQVDLNAARERGIAVFNAPYSNTRSVAELVLAEAILLLRGIPEKNASCHRGGWIKSAANSFEIRGKKLGIVGYGSIGTQLSVLAEGLGMQVFFYDIVDKLQTEINDRITEIFAGIPALYVADGHHRTAAAARVGKKRQESNPNHTGNEEYCYFLAVTFPASQLRIIDYNRVVKDLNGMTTEQFLKALEKNFTVEPKGKEIYHPSKLHNFSLYLDGQWYSLTAKPGTYDDNDPIGVLDVTVLSNLVLDQLLDIKDLRTSKRIDFVGGIRGLEELKKRVDSGEMKAAFALYPVSMQQLIDIADTGNIMPPKTTWFEPKLRSGVVIHTFEEK